MATIGELVDAFPGIIGAPENEIRRLVRALRELGAWPESARGPEGKNSRKPKAQAGHAATLLLVSMIAQDQSNATVGDALAFIQRTKFIGALTNKSLALGASWASVSGVDEARSKTLAPALQDFDAITVAASLIADEQSGDTRTYEPSQLLYMTAWPGVCADAFYFTHDQLFPALGEQETVIFADPKAPTPAVTVPAARRRSVTIPGAVYRAIADVLGPLSDEELEIRRQSIEALHELMAAANEHGA